MTTVESTSRHRPLVLLVEDVEESRRIRRELFESFDCTAVAVGSRSEAERELAQTPRVDLVVTDIHMPETASDSEDRSGIDLARHVKQHFVGVPVAGYSAYFEGSDLGGAVDEVFDVIFRKGHTGGTNLESQIAECVTLAEGARDRRIAKYEDKLDDLRRRYESETPSVNVVRRLALDPDPAHSGMVEGPLGAAGYRLRLVSAQSINGAEPFVVWIRPEQDGIQAEVYGRPELYSYGADEQAALGNLGELMHLISQDEGAVGEGPSPGIRSLYDFLARILGTFRPSSGQ